MNRLLLRLVFLLTLTSGALAQLGNFSDAPIEINAEQTGFERGLATADQNVVIRYGEVLIYSDHAQYNAETRDVLVEGNVRIYREGHLFIGERAVYNLESKQLTAADFAGDFFPFRFAGDSLSTLGTNAYLVKEGLFTTSDNSKPDYYIRAKTVRIYPKDRVVFSNVLLYVGRTPIFWFPYLHQSLDKNDGVQIVPGYSSIWGAYLLGEYTFPIGEGSGRLRLDVLADRGVGLGLESKWGGKGGKKGWGRFRSYFINDSSPGTNKTSLAREPIDPNRYRVSLQDRTYLTEDIYASVDINKLSDARVYQDFAPHEFRTNPNPDNVLSLTKWDEEYTATFTARKNLNEENFDLTERLPEGALDIKRQPLFGSKVFYDGETSAGLYRRNFAGGSLVDDYQSFRADTFHQLSYPGTYFGWLSVVPHAGVRGTYYENSGHFMDLTTLTTEPPSVPGGIGKTTSTTRRKIDQGGALFRPVVNANIETSFKLSRAYEQVQSRAWGLDGLRHIVQPYTNLSFVYSGQNPENILQFDRLNRSTQLQPIDFPAFNTIDSIDNWSIARLGVRNRLQTRRDNLTLNWFELDTFFDVNIDRPQFVGDVVQDGGTFSNLYNRLRFYPLPWVGLTIDSQVPIFDKGFTEVNTQLSFFANRNLRMDLGHRFISGNTAVFDSNLLTVGGYYRVNDNWAVSAREQYEITDGTLESQSYSVHRDLSSWVAALGVNVRDNRGVTDFGFILTFTLKDVPGVRIPLNLDPESLVGADSGKNK